MRLQVLLGVIAMFTTIVHAGWAEGESTGLPERTLGNPKASVRIDEYFSLDCPHCAAFDIETLPKLTAQYIASGKVRLVVHEFPLSEIALKASMLTRCADPERYFTMIDVLFHVQHAWNQANISDSIDALKQQARFAGLSDTDIERCLANRKLEDALLQSRLDAQKLVDIEVTPTFTFNGDNDDRFDGAAPYEEFVRKIDSLIAK